MAPKFGTSGLRGLVAELTPGLVADHVAAFLAACDAGGRVLVGRDLRPSSPGIAGTVIAAIRDAGLDAVDCGALPTPALALAAQEAGGGAVMVTGSHIPADRNGLKFYAAGGAEIAKADEAAILAALGRARPAPAAPGALLPDPGAAGRYRARYAAFGAGALAGRTIGLYAHSAVGRDDLAAILRDLGAVVVELGRSETFVPVDTEAVPAAIRAQLADWARAHPLDAIASTDGDSDRPLLTDAAGQVIPGDVLGQIAADHLGAETVVTPISSNGGVTEKPHLKVRLTRIGSPHVIAGMQAEGGRVLGYEANGGTLLGFDAELPGGRLAALPTRDAVLPILAALCAAAPGALADRVAAEPPRVTRSDRLQEVPRPAMEALMDRLSRDASARDALAGGRGPVAGLDRTDGIRMTLPEGRILHVRPSGNAPELRLYVEAETAAEAGALLDAGLDGLRRALG